MFVFSVGREESDYNDQLLAEPGSLVYFIVTTRQWVHYYVELYNAHHPAFAPRMTF